MTDTLDATLGRPIKSYNNKFKKYTIMYVLHSYKESKLKSIHYADSIKNNIIKEYDIKPIGYDVKKIINARTALGFTLIEFENLSKLEYFLEHYDELINVEVN